MNDELLDSLFDNYNLSNKDREELKNYIYKIYIHPEFQKRITDKFMHHDKVSLGQHILEDTIVTYRLLKNKKNNKYNLKVGLYISMFHDLYTSPWQNDPSNNTKFFHKHGFRHPIEAIINALNWFPELFEEDAYQIIDGVIHHMYPLPVCSCKNYDTNVLELQNYDLIKNIDEKYLKMIIDSSSRFKILGLSISRSKYKEGKIMSKADKKVSINNFRHTSLRSKMSLLTGKNKYIDNNNKKN